MDVLIERNEVQELKKYEFRISDFLWDIKETGNGEQYVSVAQVSNQLFHGELFNMVELRKDSQLDFEIVKLDFVDCIRVKDLVAMVARLAVNPKYKKYRQVRYFVQACKDLSTKKDTERVEYEKKVNYFERKRNSTNEYSFATIAKNAKARKLTKGKGFSK